MLFAELDSAQCCAERARFGFIADPGVQALKEKATPSMLEKYLHVLGSKMTRPFSIASTIHNSQCSKNSQKSQCLQALSLLKTAL